MEGQRGSVSPACDRGARPEAGVGLLVSVCGTRDWPKQSSDNKSTSCHQQTSSHKQQPTTSLFSRDGCNGRGATTAVCTRKSQRWSHQVTNHFASRASCVIACGKTPKQAAEGGALFDSSNFFLRGSAVCDLEIRQNRCDREQ